MPGHGLTSAFSPGTSYTQITQVPVEPYSNNLGMYGVQTPFHVAPPGPVPPPPSLLLGAGQGEFTDVKVLPSAHRAFLEENTKISAQISAGPLGVSHITMTYYDGDPSAGGKLFDHQKLATIPPNATAQTRTFFRPGSCGPHTIFAVASAQGVDSATGAAQISVRVDVADVIQDMITVTKTLQVSPPVKKLLIRLLEAAQLGYSRDLNLKVYSTLIREQGTRISTKTANKLLGEADTILSCKGN